MPTALAADVLRRPIILVAAWLVVLQAFLAGVATAQAAGMIASGPLDAAAICHGAGGPSSPDRSTPDPERIRTLCCTFCGISTVAGAPAGAPDVTPSLGWALAQPPVPTPFFVSVARTAVRDGPSQAPPHRA